MKALPVILCAVVLPLCSAANAGEMVKTNVPASRSLARPNPQSEMDMIKVQNLVNQRAQSAALASSMVSKMQPCPNCLRNIGK